MRLEWKKKKSESKCKKKYPVYHLNNLTFSQECCPICVCPGWKRLVGTASRAVPLAACDMLELGLIHSPSLAGSGIPIVMWSLTCTQHDFARGEQAEAGGKGTAVGGHPAVPFNGWIRCHIIKKKRSQLAWAFFFVSLKGHEDRLSICWEKKWRNIFFKPFSNVPSLRLVLNS